MADGIADVDDWIDFPERSSSRNRRWRRTSGSIPLACYYSSSESLDWFSEDDVGYWSEQGADGCHCCDGKCQAGREVRRQGCTGCVGNQVNVICGDAVRSADGKSPRPRRPNDQDQQPSKGYREATAEDMLYNLARCQRRYNQEKGRVEDWLRYMTDEGRREREVERGRERVEERRRYDYERVEERVRRERDRGRREDERRDRRRRVRFTL